MKLYTHILFFLLIFSCNTEKNNSISTIETLPYYNDNDFTPKWENVNHTIKPFKLINQFGDTVSEKTIKGKISVANFFFTTCPSICPKMTSNFKRIQDSLKNNSKVILLSHSVTPETDNVQKLNNYAKNKSVGPNWHLLTTDSTKNMNKHIRQSFLIGNNKAFTTNASSFIHTEKVVLIDPKLKIRGVYNGTLAIETKRILDDIEMLKKEFNF